MAAEFDRYKFPTKYGETDYFKMVVGLLPKGIIWGVERIAAAVEWINTHTGAAADYEDTPDADREIEVVTTPGYSGSSALGLALSVIGSEFSRVEVDAWEVLNTSDPGVATDTLEDWERVLALPDAGYPAGSSVEDRQRVAHAKLFDASKVQDAQWYIDFAASLGLVVTVEELPAEYSESRCGVARCGFSRCVGSFYSAFSLLRITIVSGTGDPALLIAAVEKLKPAHVAIEWIDLT